jgi:hypothetical protein
MQQDRIHKHTFVLVGYGGIVREHFIRLSLLEPRFSVSCLDGPQIWYVYQDEKNVYYITFLLYRRDSR